MLLDPSRRPVIGHRGNRAHAPENTLVSFAQAVAAGVDAIECDLHLTRDGVPVVLHDPTIDRTTDLCGTVADLTLAELRHADAGARFSSDGGLTFPYRGHGITVPRLEEVLVAHPAVPVLIEIKSVVAARPVLSLLQRMGATDRVLIGSFDDAALVPFSDAGIPVAGATRALSRLFLRALFGIGVASLPFQAMCIPLRHRGLPLPVTGFARMMRAHGGATHVWTVNDRRLARSLWARGVQGIISDDPAVILAERAGLA